MPEEAAVIAETTAPDKSRKAKPARILPTDRIAYPKQIDILRAYAIAAEANNRAVTNADIAGIVNMAATTVPHANSFFADLGLLQKVEGGYLPNQDVVNFHRAYAWNQETAAQKLAPTLQGAWFSQALLPRITLRTMDESEAVGILAEASGATPEFKSQLGLLLNYLESAGLITREGGQVKAARPSMLQQVAPSQPTVPASEPGPPATRGVETTFSRPTTGDGVQLNVSINVDMKEMGTWTPDRIAAFFAGFAQVLAAKGALEKNASKE